MLTKPVPDVDTAFPPLPNLLIFFISFVAADISLTKVLIVLATFFNSFVAVSVSLGIDFFIPFITASCKPLVSISIPCLLNFIANLSILFPILLSTLFNALVIESASDLPVTLPPDINAVFNCDNKAFEISEVATLINAAISDFFSPPEVFPVDPPPYLTLVVIALETLDETDFSILATDFSKILLNLVSDLVDNSTVEFLVEDFVLEAAVVELSVCDIIRIVLSVKSYTPIYINIKN